MLSLPQGAPALSSCAECLPCSEMQLSTGSQVRIIPSLQSSCLLLLPPPICPHCQTSLMLCAILQSVDLFSYGSLPLLFSIQNCSISDMKTRSVVSSIRHTLCPCVLQSLSSIEMSLLLIAFVFIQNPVVGRTLTLISKSIQSLGNIAAPKVQSSPYSMLLH